MNNLKRKVTRGIVWIQVSTLIVSVVNFLMVAILAWLLPVEEFGLIGMLIVVISFIQMFSDFGLTTAIIQKKDLSREQLSTLFTLNIFLGAVLCCGCYFSSTVVATFFNKRELSELIKILSWAFLFIAIGQTYKALLQKQFKFFQYFLVDLLSNLVYGFTTIGLALTGRGSLSLAYGFLFFQIAIVVLGAIVEPFRPVLLFRFRETRQLIRFGGYIVGERFLNYFNRNLDYVFVGKFLGARPLGFYTLAYTVMLVPVYRIAGVIMQVIFPVFARIQTDDSRICKGYLKVLKCISLIVFPLMACLFVYANEFVILLFGREWEPAVLILKIFCLLGALQSIGTTVGTVIYAKGRADISFRWNLFAVLMYGTAFWIGTNWGVVGVAIMYTLFSIVLLPVIQIIANSLIELKIADFLKNFRHALRIAAIILLASALHKYVLESVWDTGMITTLISGIILDIAVYGSCLYIWEGKLVKEILAEFTAHD